MVEELKQPNDPSSLTTAQLMHEIEVLKEMVFRENTSLKEQLTFKIESIETAVKVAHDDLVRVPTDVQKQVGSLKELIAQQFESEGKLRDEKFAGVQIQFEATDKRADQTSKDAKTAVDVGLQAAKELVAEKTISAAQAAAKQEASFSKQIDAQGTLIQATVKAFDEKIDDVKERITRIEGSGSGRSQMWAWVGGGILLLIAIFGLFMKLGQP